MNSPQTEGVGLALPLTDTWCSAFLDSAFKFVINPKKCDNFLLLCLFALMACVNLIKKKINLLLLLFLSEMNVDIFYTIFKYSQNYFRLFQREIFALYSIRMWPRGGAWNKLLIIESIKRKLDSILDCFILRSS